MKKTVTAFVFACLVTGCVAQNLNKGLSALVGQNIQVAVAKLGYPDSQRTMLGDTIYVWGSHNSFSMPITNTSTTTGMVGGTPVYGSTSSTSYVPINADCTIQVAADANGTIKNYQWSGNMIGCDAYASAVTR